MWRAEQHRALTGIDPSAGSYTVSDAMRDYEAAFVARGGKAVRSVQSIAASHILPALGTVECPRLTKAQITAWFNAIVTDGRLNTGRAGRSGRGRRAVDRTDTEAMRRRRSTANRILTVLKAALNHAHREGRVVSDVAWRTVKPFRSVDGVRTLFLQPREAGRLIAACEGAFRALVQGALLTGCRYGELCRLKVGDVDTQTGVIHVRESKSGKPRHVPLNGEGLTLFAHQVAGKTVGSTVFSQGGQPWKASEQARPMKRACEAAGLNPVITFHGLRDTTRAIW